MGRGEGAQIDPANGVTGLRAEVSRNKAAAQQFDLTKLREIERENRTRPRTFGPVLIETPDGDPIVGLSYHTDYKAEEEYGVADIRKAITGSDPLRFSQTEEGAARIRFFSDCNGMVLSVDRPDPQDQRELSWGEPLAHWSSQTDYASFYQQRMLQNLDISKWSTVSELRERAKSLGVKPLPTKKAALLSAITAAVTETTDPERALFPGWFQNGDDLVLRADGDGPTAQILRKLICAAREGRLGIGDGSGAFKSGLVLFDAGDMTPGQITQITEAHRWHEEKMAELKPVEEELSERGHSFLFLGNPSEISTEKGEEPKLRYWLNGMSKRGRDGYPQPYGWYTLQELRAEKFATDARARQAEREAAAAASK